MQVPSTSPYLIINQFTLNQEDLRKCLHHKNEKWGSFISILFFRLKNALSTGYWLNSKNILALLEKEVKRIPVNNRSQLQENITILFQDVLLNAEQTKKYEFLISNSLCEQLSETAAYTLDCVSLEEAKRLILTQDFFLASLSDFDRQVRMKASRNVSSDEFLNFYQKQVKPLQANDLRDFKEYLNSIKAQLNEYGIQLPPIQIIRTTGQEEIPGTWAYCRHTDTIVFKNMTKQLFTHELFHIYSRNHPEMREKLYALVGYHVIAPLAIPDSLKGKRLVNPDVPFLDAYINVGYQGQIVPAVPIDLYDEAYQGRGKSSFLKGVYHKFAQLETEENGAMQFKLDEQGEPLLFDFEEAEGLEEQIGRNTNYVDSPEEILADNFALMILDQKGRTPGLIEKMKACFKENSYLNAQ